MKYFLEQISVLNDGQVAAAIYEKTSEAEALSAFHMTLASSIINENVRTTHVEAKNELGGIIKSETWDANKE